MAERTRRLTEADVAAARYFGEADDFDLAKDPRCLWGWGPPACPHRWGHFCSRALGHDGLCGDDGTGCYRKRPADWDATGRAEANR